MQLQVIDKYIDTSPISRLITQGENGVDVITIPLPKMRAGTDLSALTYTMRGVSEKETLAAQVLEKTTDGETVLLKWNITSDFTAVAGGLMLSITGVNASGEKIIHYTAGAISIGKTPAKDFPAPQLDIFEQLLTQAQAALQAATAQADKAKAEADRLAEFGISFKLLGFYPTLEELQAAVPTPAQSDAYGVGTAPVYVYLWNGNAWQRGQPLTIDLTEYYTKATTDSKFATKSEITALNATKAPLASPAFTGGATIGGKEIPTTVSGTWRPLYHGSGVEGTPTFRGNNGKYTIIGKTVFLDVTTTFASLGGMTGNLRIKGFPYLPTATGYAIINIAEINGKNGQIYGCSGLIMDWAGRCDLHNVMEKRLLSIADLKDNTTIYALTAIFDI